MYFERDAQIPNVKLGGSSKEVATK